MTDAQRCEPPEHLRDRDGWHWCNLHGHTQPAPERWIAERQMWWDLGATYAAPTIAAAAGYRYLAPVAPPAVVRELVEALDVLVMQRDAHFHTTQAWDTARAVLHRAKEAGV